jgi:nucleoside-diphosphate-sugar epimerase
MNLNPKITSTNDNMYLNQNHSSHIQTQTSSTTKYDFLSYKIALWQNYNDKKFIAVRYPFVVGKDDYTKRLLFYVEHTIKGIAMNIDNIDCQMGYIDSKEAGDFMAYLVNAEYKGAVNGCSYGTISLREIIEYVENKCNVKAILSPDGDNAPYNNEVEYSINTDLAKSLGYEFSNLNDWIYDLIDYYIELVLKS